MKKYFALIFLFLMLSVGCGQAHTYTPAIISSSRIDLSSAAVPTESFISETAPVVLSAAPESSSQNSFVSTVSKVSSKASSQSVSSKSVSAVLSVPSAASSKKTSSDAASSRPGAASSAASSVPAVTNGQEIQVITLTSPIVRGQEASVTIKGTPGVEYAIKVIYKSGPSSAKGLEPKNADSGGRVTWSWKVSARTTAGSWSIEISGGGASVTVPFIVTV